MAKTYCVVVADDGQVSVYIEPGQEEGEEMQQGEPVDGLAGAFAWIESQENPAAGETMGHGAAVEQADFEAGFKGARGA